MIFTNYNEIATTKDRKNILNLVDSGIKTVLPKQFMYQNIKLVDEKLFIQDQEFSVKGKRIFVIGAGKAAASMAVELENIIGDKIVAGLVISNDKLSKTKKILIHQANHPVPSQKSIDGARKILALKNKYNISRKDLLIVLLSGGASSLMSLPLRGISLAEKVKLIKVLINCGANAHEVTILKKKISQVKGGKLAEFFKPTPIISLILSDVANNDMSVIASGPFAKDTTTHEQAIGIIEKYKIHQQVSKNVLLCFKKEQIFKNDKSFSHVKQFILADNNLLLKNLVRLAKVDGLQTIVKADIQGEAKAVADKICNQVFSKSIKKPTLFLYGGETTVTLHIKHGKGGRNQEFVLACLDYLNKNKIKNKWCIASIATDGIDFITESAGAIIDNNSLALIKHKKYNLMDYLKKHDSYSLLSKIQANVCVGHTTGTNVCDIVLFLIKPI